MPANENKKILIVDDDLTIRKLLKHHLNKNNYETFEATNISEGLEQLHKNNIDLVLCDVVMEGGDGFTFCQTVRKEEKYAVLPFIFVTARNSHEDKAKALEVGGDELITKPFEIKDLLSKVQALLRRAQIFNDYGTKKSLMTSAAKHSPKILVVDDDPMFTRLLSYSLKKENYECIISNSAEEALRIIRNITPDLIISDIMMPKVDGFEFRRLLLEDSNLKSIPFVFLSSNGTESNILDGYDLDITDYVLKTMGNKVILAKINSILNNLSKERAKIVSELNTAVDSMHAKVVPDKTPSFGNFIIEQWHQPFEGIPGGDFIDYFQINDDNLAIILGDVMGKKWGAWYFTFAYAGYVRSSVRMVLQNAEEFTPSKILQQVNNSVYQDAKVSEVFTTLSIVLLDKKNFLLKYSGAGDLPLIHKKNDSNSINEIVAKGSLLGFKLDGDYQDTIVSLNKGDSIIMFTDGITDSRNANGQPFGSDRIHEILINSKNGNVFNEIKDKLISFTGGHFDDDISLISIQIA